MGLNLGQKLVRTDSGFREPLSHFGLLQFLREFVDFPGKNSLQIVGGVIDSMVSHSRLRKVVSTNFLRAVAGSDQSSALGRIFFLLFALFGFKKFGAENLKSLLLILTLAPAVLALDLNARG
jgi:hypothetical protein